MQSKKAIFIAALCWAIAGGVYAKLPAPQLTDEQKAKAEETKAKAAEAAKKDGELLAKSQDRVADRYIKAQKAKGITVKPTPVVVAAAPAPAAKPAAAAAPAPVVPAKK
ncbi:MAG: formate dehydrogenase [Betaproteobacteria bacterium]|nr:formate dehydrogenase [Betaproteobacteria bacterium]